MSQNPEKVRLLQAAAAAMSLHFHLPASAGIFNDICNLIMQGGESM